MSNCKEFLLDDMMAITAVPIANITVNAPVWPTIRTALLGTNRNGAIVIGRNTDAAIIQVVPIIRESGKAKDDEGDSVAAREHTVTVTCEADDRDPAAWEDLFRLERTPRHLLLTFRGGQRAFVHATEDNYLCTVDRDGSKTSVTFRIHNTAGIQLIV